MSASAYDRPLGLFNLQLGEVIADPWEFYDRLRFMAPVYFDPFIKSFLVSRHCDVQHLLAHPDTSVRMDHADSLVLFGAVGLDEAFAYLDLHVSFIDAPDHARMRRPLAEPLQIRRVRSDLLEPMHLAIADTLAEIGAESTFDAVSVISSKVPIRVTQHLLDMHDVDIATVERWSHAWGDVISAPGHVPTTNRPEILRIVGELAAFLRELVARHEQHSRNTVVGGLVAHMQDGAMTRDELIANLMMLVAAGNETTAHLISNELMALADDPALWALIKGRPDLVGAVAEELSRMYPPTQFTARRVLSPIELSTGDVVPAGVSVVLMLAAANRDPEAFPDPNRVQVGRAGARPVTFGYGPHACFGAALARQEVQLTLAALVDRFDWLVPLEGRRWRQNGNLRGLSSLPLQAGSTTTAARR